MIKDNPLFPRCNEVGASPKNEMIAIEGGKIRLGTDETHHPYGWDNEYGKQEVEVSSFKTSKFLVSNGEFLDFVSDDGYENGC